MLKTGTFVAALSLLITGCGRLPVANDISLNFAVGGEAMAANLNNTADSRYTVMVRTDALPADVIATAATATLHLGSLTVNGSYFPVEAGNTYFQFNLGNRCRAELAGDNVTLRYDILDRSGNVTRTESAVLPHVNGC